MPIDLAHGLIARWSDPEPAHVPLLREAGIETVVLDAPNARFSEQIPTVLKQDLAWMGVKELAGARPAKPVVLTEGKWPGVARGTGSGNFDEVVASASREPWVELNEYWVAWLRALFPDRAAVLSYAAAADDKLLPYDSLELALIEARAAGGNYILNVEPRYREALLKGEERALAAWRQLGQTARWLREHRELFEQTVFPQITLLVQLDEETPEIAKLMYRRNASPALAPAARPPAPSPRCLALVAVELKPPAPAARNTILAHADAGGCVVVNGDWWKTSRLKQVRKDEDRDVFALGKGQVVAYRDAISDPSEFALDVIDLITHRRRAVRLWNGRAAVGVATGKGVLQCINYGSPVRMRVQARIQGSYSHAVLMRPEAADIELKTAPRGTTTEVYLPELRRLGVVVFS